MKEPEKFFENFGIKTVSATDVSKKAYVLSEDQLRAVRAADIEPATTRPGPPFRVEILFEPAPRSVEASFYESVRRGSGRPPEPRMGREIVRDWMKPGDTIVIGNIGRKLFAAKLGADPTALPEKDKAVERDLEAEILARALRAKGQPERKKRSRDDFERNPYVVEAALRRANGACDTPSCSAELFVRDSGWRYLEVHHVRPLADGGEDALHNACALCPRCHRRLHFGRGRAELQEALRQQVLQRYDQATGRRRSSNRD